MSNLCQNLSVSKNYPLTCINQEICGQKQNLYAIFWKIFTFMKFCGYYYDIHENKIIFISNASWEILIEHFLADFQCIMEVSKLPWLQKREYCDNRPPSGWLRGAKSLGPVLGPLTSFPSV